jgi:hypothetical protein
MSGMSFEILIGRLRNHDWDILNAQPDTSADVSARLERSLPSLDDTARWLAASLIVKWDRPGAGETLLRISADPHLQVASEAAIGLRKVRDTADPEKILRVAPKRATGIVRGELYLAAGQLGSPEHLPALWRAMRRESDEEASLDGRAAAVKLGDPIERDLFRERVANATPGSVKRLISDLLYIGHWSHTVALDSWFGQMSPITRVGHDATPRSARMCDMAVWVAHRLGIGFSGGSENLIVYPQETIDAARAAVRDREWIETGQNTSGGSNPE